MVSLDERIIVEQDAESMPDLKKVRLSMLDLHLHQYGTFSNVYRGTLLNPLPIREVAIKKTWHDRGAKSFEHEFLQGVGRPSHKNIIQMAYAFTNTCASTGKICEAFVFEFMPSTLTQTMISEGRLELLDVKLYTWQLFSGLSYLEANLIAHRDIKPDNLLVDSLKGLLKIGDFGSAKVISYRCTSSTYQVTRFYRAPELLLYASEYDCKIDVWSAGCVLAEMLRGDVLFAGGDRMEMLKFIIQTIGSPTKEELKAMRVTRVSFSGEPISANGFVDLLHYTTHDARSIVASILVYIPNKRLCGTKLLNNEWFNALFRPGELRKNGRAIADILTTADRAAISIPHPLSELAKKHAKLNQKN